MSDKMDREGGREGGRGLKVSSTDDGTLIMSMCTTCAFNGGSCLSFSGRFPDAQTNAMTIASGQDSATVSGSSDSSSSTSHHSLNQAAGRFKHFELFETSVCHPRTGEDLALQFAHTSEGSSLLALTLDFERGKGMDPSSTLV